MYWVIGPISGNSFSTDIRLHYTRSPVRPQNLVIAYQSSAYICSSYLVTWDKQICYVGQLLHVNTCEYPVLGIMSGTGTREQPKRVCHRFLPTDRYKLSQSFTVDFFSDFEHRGIMFLSTCGKHARSLPNLTPYICTLRLLCRPIWYPIRVVHSVPCESFQYLCRLK